MTQELKKSNERLLDELELAGKLEPRDKNFVRTNVTLMDALGDDKREPGGVFGGDGPGRVMGGRLGRDHTLEDVPHHFLRDCLMDYINRTIAAEHQDDARKAVFPDLTPAEIEEYSTIVAENTEK